MQTGPRPAAGHSAEPPRAPESGAVPGRRRLAIGGLIAIMAVSLTLLGYVGYGEAWRTYPKFELERLAAQGSTVRTTLDPFLQAGLPIGEFPGFVPLTRPLLDSDHSIAAIFVEDSQGKLLFSNQQPGQGTMQTAEFHPSTLQNKTSHFQVAESETAYRVSLELRNKIEPVGTLQLVMPRQAIADEIRTAYVARVLLGGVLLLLAFTLLEGFLTRRTKRPTTTRTRAMSYGIVFLLMAVVVVWSLVDVYSDGIRDKTRALANSLGERIEAPLQLGLALSDFSQIEAIFADYRQLYPELSYLALTEGDTILLDTDPRLIGGTWVPYPGHYAYAAAIPSGIGAHAEPLAVRAGIPNAVIYEQIWRSAKNFFVLFLASGFLAMMLFEILNTFTTRPAGDAPRPQIERTFQEHIILPILFFTIFIEALSTSFMPQHLQQLAQRSGADPGIVSMQFTVYYAALAIALLPVGRFIDRGQMKWVLLLAVVMEIVSLVLMATVTNSYLMFPIRGLAGASHGIMATGAQAYLLLLAARGGMTQGASRFLFTYNSGIIAGTAIGALLAVYMGFTGVFALAALLILPVLVFAARFLPTKLAAGDSDIPVATASQPPLVPSIVKAVSDAGFASAVLFVGIPAKIVNAGVIAFALPLLLAHATVPQEDIGQIIMFYPIGILLMSLIVARIVARLGAPRPALIIGTGVGAAAVAAVGILGAGMGIPGASSAMTLLLVGSLLVLGLAHGMINAPIVTYVASGSAAEQLGRSTISSVYRFVERTGHMVGPILISQLLILSQQSPAALAWIGLPIVIFGLFFWLESGRRAAARLTPASA